MSIYGYERKTSPNIDEFFAKGTRYEYAYSTEANTGPSTVSFLSGMLPLENGVRLQCQKVPKDSMLVSDYLAAVGYRTAGIVSNVVLTGECTDLNLHFDYYDDFVDEKEPYRQVYERNARSTTAAGVEWLTKFYSPDRPFFLWIHYQDTHGPYHPPDDKPVDFTHDEPVPISLTRVPRYQREPGVNDGLEYGDLYDEELAYLDEHLGRLLDLFEEQGVLENTIVIFSADHGESMMEHERWFTHGYHVYEEIIRVPLMFRYPHDNDARLVKTRVSLIDVVPTILDLAGVELPVHLRGQVLGDSIQDHPVYAQGGEWRSMTYRDQKWIIQIDEETKLGVRRHRYDLIDDPGELEKKAWVETKEARDFFELIANDPDPGGIPLVFVKGMRMDAPKVRPGLDEATMKKLQSLGYVK